MDIKNLYNKITKSEKYTQTTNNEAQSITTHNDRLKYVPNTYRALYSNIIWIKLCTKILKLSFKNLKWILYYLAL